MKLAEEHETTTERQSAASGPSITQNRSNSELAHETGFSLLTKCALSSGYVTWVFLFKDLKNVEKDSYPWTPLNDRKPSTVTQVTESHE